jgi:hypothetical protein
MSVDSDCGIMVGLPYDMIKLEDLDELIDSGELEITSCHYDSPRDQNIVGFWIYYGHGKEIEPSKFADEIKKARQKFLGYIDLEPKVFTALHIT